MSLGSWDPDADQAAQNLQIESSTLDRFIGLSEAQQLEKLEEHLTGTDSQKLSGLMQLDSAAWLSAAQPLSDQDVLHLVRFFTVAENLPGWESGANSPVIPLAKTLRKRGVKLDKDLLRWIRSVSDNRYLPYGAL